MVPAAIIVLLATAINLVMTVLLWIGRAELVRAIAELDERQRKVEDSQREVVAWVKLPAKEPNV